MRTSISELTGPGRNAWTSLRQRTMALPPLQAVGASRETIADHVRDSPHLHDGVFANVEPTTELTESQSRAAMEMFRRGKVGTPGAPVAVTTPEFVDVPAQLAATWLGHATVLVEIDGVRVLTDPVFSRRCSPSQLVGPARMHRAPCRVADLPRIDVVLLSHDHYDHLDVESVVALSAQSPDAVFVAPIGVGAHLQGWGVAPTRIREADWGESVDAAGLTFNCCYARHFSGRGLVRNLTLWASWAVQGRSANFFFSGDSGPSDRFAEVGELFGPFGLTLIAIGAYDRLWPDIHLDPEQAVSTHQMVSRGEVTDTVMLPIHWATFNLALHPWADPVQRLLTAADERLVPVVTPPPGARFDVVAGTGPGIAEQTWWEASV
ncbi:MBL fold metallo-hydrolase [Williamsia sterculiae]|nr:MBL fold metallo-hydrolase [Williamsia sterculiae]